MPNDTATTRLRDTWPLHRHQVLQLTVACLALIGAWILIGLLLTHTLDGSRIVHADVSVSSWFAQHRTTGWNRLTSLGSALADTTVKIVVTAVVAVAMLWRWKRWREPLMIVIPLVLEALTFIIVTTLIGRPRPSLPLDSSPVNSSYPSGHMAAAVAYTAFVAAVGLSRLYRGMHYPTDIVMGGLLGGVSVIVTVMIMRRAETG